MRWLTRWFNQNSRLDSILNVIECFDAFFFFLITSSMVDIKHLLVFLQWQGAQNLPNLDLSYWTHLIKGTVVSYSTVIYTFVFAIRYIRPLGELRMTPIALSSQNHFSKCWLWSYALSPPFKRLNQTGFLGLRLSLTFFSWTKSLLLIFFSLFSPELGTEFDSAGQARPGYWNLNWISHAQLWSFPPSSFSSYCISLGSNGPVSVWAGTGWRGFG